MCRLALRPGTAVACFWFHCECHKAGVVLQDLEEAASALSRSIETGRKDKSQLLVDIVETEKQVRTCIVSSGHFPCSARCSVLWVHA